MDDGTALTRANLDAFTVIYGDWDDGDDYMDIDDVETVKADAVTVINVGDMSSI